MLKLDTVNIEKIEVKFKKIKRINKNNDFILYYPLGTVSLMNVPTNPQS